MRTTRSPALRLAWLGLALWLGAAPGVRAETPAPAGETWYAIEIAGQPAGWMVERRAERDGPKQERPKQERHIVTETEMELRLKRGATELTLGLASRFVETADGRPIEMGSRQKLGTTPVEITGRFVAAGVELQTSQEGSTTRQTLPVPAGPWLPPAAAARFVERQMAAGADRFSFLTVDPLLGVTSFEVVHQRAGAATEVSLPSGSVEATPWKQVSQAAGGVEATIWVDGRGRMVKSVTPMMGVELVLTLADRETAKAGGGAPELMVRTFVKPQRPIPEPRRATSGRYRLSLSAGEPLELPSTGAQTVELRDGKAEVEVRARAWKKAEEADPSPFLASSSFLNFRDPKIEELRDRALAKVGKSPAEKAEALRAFVHRYLARKDLATGFATATEVAASASGDCTEHAVLLAALLRSAGIPSRVAAGLLYVEEFAGERDVFGYHMWTEALLRGVWTPLDAMTEEPFDATHVTLAVSPLNDGGDFPAASARLARTMGSLQIEILAVVP